MSDNRYAVIFSGQLKDGVSPQVVTSNLVLDIGLQQEKAVKLLRMGRVVLKRCATLPEAQRLAEKFDRAGAICIIEDRFERAHAMERSAAGESSFVRFISKFIPTSYRKSVDEGDTPRR